MELLDAVGLQVAASGPPSPVADRKGVVDVHGQRDAVGRMADVTRLAREEAM